MTNRPKNRPSIWDSPMVKAILQQPEGSPIDIRTPKPDRMRVFAAGRQGRGP